MLQDSKSWDMDRDPDELLQHIRGQLAGDAGRVTSYRTADAAAAIIVLYRMQIVPNNLQGNAVLSCAGVLEPSQYELLEFIGIGQDWDDGRPLLKLWLKDPQRWQA